MHSSKITYGDVVRTPATWPAPRRDYVEGQVEEELTSRIKVVDFTMRELWRRRDCSNKGDPFFLSNITTVIGSRCVELGAENTAIGLLLLRIY
jgi:hypothetical protein